VKDDEFWRISVVSWDNPAEGFDDGLGGISGCRKHFEHAKAAAISPDAVGEGASSVDGDAERLGAAGHGLSES
jgi:hypothetical protein